MANIIFLINLKKAYFILRPSRIRPIWIKALSLLIWLTWAFNALGQGGTTPIQPAKGGLPPATVPAQRVPDSKSVLANDTTPPQPAQKKPAGRVVVGPSSGSITLPNSQTGSASANQESDLERELNQRQSVPNRLGTGTKRQISPTPSPVTQPARQDSSQSVPAERVVTVPDATSVSPVQLTLIRLQPKPVRLTQRLSNKLITDLPAAEQRLSGVASTLARPRPARLDSTARLARTQPKPANQSDSLRIAAKKLIRSDSIPDESNACPIRPCNPAQKNESR
ncbi:MAG: hypothetical protein EOO39_46685 [Cytophagaceae bacterium]|nr:MAG: hypothetical protein EOO39_46685 [Cytophagaceae bacterium]